MSKRVFWVLALVGLLSLLYADYRLGEMYSWWSLPVVAIMNSAYGYAIGLSYNKRYR